jgi:hypothetical protein
MSGKVDLALKIDRKQIVARLFRKVADELDGGEVSGKGNKEGN